MQILIDVQPPYPPQINQSYTPFGFWKFGCCAWVYNGYRGQIEWINSPHFVTEPKYANPTSFDYYFNVGVIAVVTPNLQVDTKAPGIILNDVLYNMASGEGMPILLPNPYG
jgi:hypothetical protein